jgi:HD-GYP domain-containing protein (c-di-GMP phosphodiesterase class II)
MTLDRPYRRAMSPEDALEELRRHSGTHFDRSVVEALLEHERAGVARAWSEAGRDADSGR